MRKTKAEAAATRDAILEAAALVFERRGVARTSLEEIAREAGVTRGAVYWHFKNKADLFLALHEGLYVPFSETVLRDLESDHPEPLRQLEELCVRVLEELEGNEKKRRILKIVLLRCDYGGEMEQVLDSQNERRAANHKLFERYFERAKRMGHLPPDAKPKILTRSLFCYLNGIVLEAIRNPGALELGSQARALMRQFFSGVAS